MKKIYVLKLAGIKENADIAALQNLTDEDTLILLCKRGETIQSELLPILMKLETEQIVYYREEVDIVKDLLLLGQLSANADVIAVGMNAGKPSVEKHDPSTIVQLGSLLKGLHTVSFAKNMAELFTVPAKSSKPAAKRSKTSAQKLKISQSDNRTEKPEKSEEKPAVANSKVVKKPTTCIGTGTLQSPKSIL